MFLKFVDRTWILLRRLIDKGEKEGTVKHIEIPVKEWNMLVSEWNDLNPNIQKQYIARVKVISSDGIPTLHPEFTMKDDFVDKWIAEEYTVYYRDVKLILQMPALNTKVEEKATSGTELNIATD